MRPVATGPRTADAEAGCPYPVAAGFPEAQGIHGQAKGKAGKLFPEMSQRHPKVEQRPDRHIPGNPGVAVEIEYLQGKPFKTGVKIQVLGIEPET